MPNVTAESKRRQRARNSGSIAALKTNAGSSGAGGLVNRMERRTFEDLADELEPGQFFVGKITDQRTLSNGSIMVSMVLPAAYAHEAIDAVIDSQAMFTAIQLFHVPLPVMLPDPEDDGDDG